MPTDQDIPLPSRRLVGSHLDRTADDSVHRRSAVESWLLGILLVAAVVLAYSPAWNAGFIWDDDNYVTHNPLLTAPDGLSRIWFSTDSPSQYFPLVYTTFRFERSLWGLNASGFHWVNILLHAANALLVWQLLRRLRVPGAWLGAAIFALHPVQVESVAWITELKNVQSLFFFLLALLAWTAFVERTSRAGSRTALTAQKCRAGSPDPAVATAASDKDQVVDSNHRLETAGSGDPALQPNHSPSLGNATPPVFYGLALLCHALALFSKTTACTLPAALLLILWLRHQPIRRRRLLEIAPFVALGLAMGILSIWWEHHHQGTVGDHYTIGHLERVIVASRAAWFYLGKLLWPAPLIFSYAHWKIVPSDPLAYGWLLAGIGVGVAIYFARRRVGRGVEVAALFFVAMLAPMLGFFMMYTFRYTFVADHYQYVAMIGPAALFAAGVCAIGAKRVGAARRLVPVVVAAVVVLLGVLTWRQAHMYRNLETLWRTTIARNPDSYMGHNNLGVILLGRGETDAAIRSFQRALEILPDHGNAHGNLANALWQAGKADEALAHFRRAIEVEPGSAKAHSDLAFVLLQRGQFPEATGFAEKAVALEPRAAEAHNILAVVYLRAGRVDEAIEAARKAVQIQPNDADAHDNLAAAALQKGDIETAIEHGVRALAIRPDFADAHLNLGTAFVNKGQFDLALAHLRRSVDLQPGLVRGHINLGNLLAQNGGAAEAIEHFQMALKSAPGNVEARLGLGRTLLDAGKPEEAIVHLRQVVNAQPNLPEAYFHLAVASFQLKRADEGNANLAKVSDLQPNDGEVQNSLGWALLQAGRPDDAIARLQSALKLRPDLVAAHINLAIARLQKGDAAAAIAEYNAFLAQQPDHPYALADLAWILATWRDGTLRNGGKALELAQRANQLSGDHEPNVLRVLAAAYAETGQYAVAATTAQRALQLAEASGNRELADAIRGQLKCYEAGAPFRDSGT